MRNIIVAFPPGIRRAGIVHQLKENRWDIVKQADSHQDVQRAVMGDQTPVLVVLSEEFEGGSLRALIKSIHRLNKNAEIIVWCTTLAGALDFRFNCTGIKGLVMGELGTDRLIRCCATVHLGQKFYSTNLKAAFRRYLKQLKEHRILGNLSKRESQIFMMIGAGTTVSDIAERLSITNKTVNTFRYRLFDKLQVSSDVHIAHICFALGLFVPVLREDLRNVPATGLAVS